VYLFLESKDLFWLQWQHRALERVLPVMWKVHVVVTAHHLLQPKATWCWNVTLEKPSLGMPNKVTMSYPHSSCSQGLLCSVLCWPSKNGPDFSNKSFGDRNHTISSRYSAGIQRQYTCRRQVCIHLCRNTGWSKSSVHLKVSTLITVVELVSKHLILFNFTAFYS
jgi:hypothetical protein